MIYCIDSVGPWILQRKPRDEGNLLIFCPSLSSIAEIWRETDVLHPSLWRVEERSRESMGNNFHCTVGGRLFTTLDRGPWWPLRLLFMSTSVYLHLCVPFLLLLLILLSFLFILLCIPLLLLRFVFRNPLHNWAFESTSFNPLGSIH